MVTQEFLKRHLHYDEETGIFTWIISLGKNRLSGKSAGHTSKFLGYVCISLDSKSYWAHRLAWLYVHGKFPSGSIDHINGIKDDNRISNLRDVTHSQNMQNKKCSKSGRLGIVGVYEKVGARRTVYKSHIVVGKKLNYIGTFMDVEDAAAAYLRMRHMLHSIPVDFSIS